MIGLNGLSHKTLKVEILQKVVDGPHSGDLLLEFFGTLHQFGGGWFYHLGIGGARTAVLSNKYQCFPCSPRYAKHLSEERNLKFL